MRKTKTKELLKLMKEHPELCWFMPMSVTPMVFALVFHEFKHA